MVRVDRARFLLLTTALSAATAVIASSSGCTVKSTDTGTVTPGVDSGNPDYDGAADAYTTDSSTEDGGACLDDTGAAASCTGAQLGCDTKCNAYLTNYKKGVARSIAACLVALPSCESPTNDNAVAACVQKALAAACSDTSADTYCSPIVTSCAATDGGDAGAAGIIGAMECRELATGLNATGRTAFTTCVEGGMGAGYCKADSASCLDTLE